MDTTDSKFGEGTNGIVVLKIAVIGAEGMFITPCQLCRSVLNLWRAGVGKTALINAFVENTRCAYEKPSNTWTVYTEFFTTNGQKVVLRIVEVPKGGGIPADQDGLMFVYDTTNLDTLLAIQHLLEPRKSVCIMMYACMPD